MAIWGSGLFAIRLVEACGYQLLYTENAFDRRTASTNLNSAGARFQVRLGEFVLEF